MSHVAVVFYQKLVQQHKQTYLQPLQAESSVIFSNVKQNKIGRIPENTMENLSFAFFPFAHLLPLCVNRWWRLKVPACFVFCPKRWKSPTGNAQVLQFNFCWNSLQWSSWLKTKGCPFIVKRTWVRGKSPLAIALSFDPATSTSLPWYCSREVQTSEFEDRIERQKPFGRLCVCVCGCRVESAPIYKNHFLNIDENEIW